MDSNQVAINKDTSVDLTNMMAMTTGGQRLNAERTGQNKNNITLSEGHYNQFLSDYEARNRLLEIKDSINICELSQKYDTNKRSKKTVKFSFTPKKIILLRKRGINKIPAEGRIE